MTTEDGPTRFAVVDETPERDARSADLLAKLLQEKGYDSRVEPAEPWPGRCWPIVETSAPMNVLQDVWRTMG